MSQYQLEEFNPVDGYFNLISRDGRLLAKAYSREDALAIIEAMKKLGETALNDAKHDLADEPKEREAECSNFGHAISITGVPLSNKSKEKGHDTTIPCPSCGVVPFILNAAPIGPGVASAFRAVCASCGAQYDPVIVDSKLKEAER